nr:diguanylate cyclase [uncultured Sulfurimonas sp.]
MKTSKLYILVLALLVSLLYGSWLYVDFLKSKRDDLALSKYTAQALSMQQEVEGMILQKQKATTAMALSIVNDKKLIKHIRNKNIEQDYFEDLIKKFKKHTLYKNIWIQIIDNDFNSLYRSWSRERDDNLKNIRLDLVEVASTKKVTYSVGVGRFDISIKAIVPLFDNEKFIGMIEIISHFNSISKQLQKSDINSVVVLKKEFKKQLEFPFTNLFIDDYYVANFDAPKELRKYLKDNKIENYFTNSYKIENNFLISSYELKNKNKEAIGYFIMFKKIDAISNMDLEFFMFRWLTLGVVFIMGIAMFVSTVLYYANKRQKEYFQNIINSSTNIVLVNKKNSLLNVNNIFFKYFDMYSNVEEFKEKHNCICDFFVIEDGYLEAMMNDKTWVEYLIQSELIFHKIKVDIFGKIYYFTASASKILKEKDHYSVILTDITEQEKYKKELEHLNITDSLTNIGNRRHFQQKMKEEMERAKRYQHPLSLIMFDIDYFKQVNDKHGHSVGDEVLIKYTKFINSFLRNGDVFCRVGGEEFMLIVPHTTLSDAKKIAEKLRKNIQEYKKVIPITMSFGVVEYVEGEDMEFIFKRVDDALYKAKESGRNMVVVG